MNSREFRQYKFLVGLFRSLKSLGLRRFFNRVGFGLYYLVKCKRQYRIEVVSPNSKLPRPCIITINHVSDEDTVIIQALNELFWHHDHLSLLFAHFNFEKVYAPYIIWVEGISNIGTGTQVVERMAKTIGHGGSVAIWPEGELSRTGALMQGFTGVARLYLRVNFGSLESPSFKKTPIIPLVPIFLEGVYESLNRYPHAIAKRKQLLQRHGTSKAQWKVIVGKPYFLECQERVTKSALELLTAKIQGEIRNLDPINRPIASNSFKTKSVYRPTRA
ncbi:MAG TPA: 1-acyl-sn-glycerol-3-phosphate acyltransferase [Candidatus Lokiarchaeia archaeon]|nr:1-acyl-sn-glycerol-3-phosphate acyltransferase [Candidatus Lokiarchaeia archaeon]